RSIYVSRIPWRRGENVAILFAFEGSVSEPFFYARQLLFYHGWLNAGQVPEAAVQSLLKEILHKRTVQLLAADGGVKRWPYALFLQRPGADQAAVQIGLQGPAGQAGNATATGH